MVDSINPDNPALMEISPTFVLCPDPVSRMPVLDPVNESLGIFHFMGSNRITMPGAAPDTGVPVPRPVGFCSST